MKKGIPLAWLVAMVASASIVSVGHAQPRPPPPEERFRPGERPLPPGERPTPPGERPGERTVPPPAVGPQATVYATRLQKLDEDRRLQRAQLRRDPRAWDAGRAARDLEHRRQLEGVWGAAFLARPECRSELEVHADRVARINRIIDLAEDQHNDALVAHARAVLNREIARNARAMAELRARLGIQ